MKLSQVFFLAAVQSISFAFAQSAPEPFKVGDIVVAGSLRTRVESWDWFEGNANNQYTYPATIARLSLSETTKTLDWQFELAAPFLLGLPDGAIATGAQGQLGLGGSYYAANSRNTNVGMVFAKQGFFRLKNLGNVEGQSLKVGRMQMIDGAEVAPKNTTLAILKRERIAHRLIGDFGFSDVGRSFDGAEFVRDGANLNLTLFGGRPTRGVFQVDGWGEININLYYGALTGQIHRGRTESEWRVFGLGYQDLRNGVLKTDNRTVAVRTADASHINIATFGGHYIHTTETSAGPVDFLAWGALQTGSWGNLAQRSGALALEGGWQPKIMPRIKPWVRAGYDYGSGDKNPNDSTHGTFFQVLPTPRVYARFPFFNMMNSRDVFGEVSVRPAKRLTLRSDIHGLRLANRNDLWYSGGGAYQPWTFGYTGRPSNGQASLAALYDFSADCNLNSHVAVGVYAGHAAGKLVIQAIYPQGKNANLGFLEMTFKF